jgi:hypothetical protein
MWPDLPLDQRLVLQLGHASSLYVFLTAMVTEKSQMLLLHCSGFASIIGLGLLQ